MKEIFVASDSIVSPLGFSTRENFNAAIAGKSGVKQQSIPEIADEIICSSAFDETVLKKYFDELGLDESLTKFEKLAIASVIEASKKTEINFTDSKTIFILSTTKGNISLLEKNVDSTDERLTLSYSAKKIAQHFKNPNEPFVVSNACISGVVAILFAQRLLQQKQFENAVVVGCDVLSKFVYEGFKSFMALSAERCKPFDESRNGLNLGEAASTIVLTSNKNLASQPNIKILSGAVTNDSNHISGPSRTGIELSEAINKALSNSKLESSQIDFISAHGTATPYNDEMEAKAFALSQLSNVPLNSLKCYFGHTLGAAGILETAMSIQSMRENKIIPILDFEKTGVSVDVTVCDKVIEKDLKFLLKTASGFGGCNGALVLGKG